MTGAFFHDHIMRHKDGVYYTTGGLPYVVLKRYLSFCNEMVVCTRAIQIQGNSQQLIQANGDHITINPIKNYHSVLDSMTKTKEIKKEVKESIESVDFVIARLPSILGNFAYQEARKQNKPCLIELVGCPWDAIWNHSGIKGKILAPYMYFKTKKIIKNASNVIYVTNEFLQRRYPTKGESIGCSDVNLEKMEEEGLTRRLQKIKEMSPSKMVKLGLIGSLDVNYKGHATAIKALANIKNKINFEIHFLGGGNHAKWEMLAKRYKIDDKVYFDGTLPAGKPVLDWLDDKDIFLIPSLQEGLPRALIEAMSRACPVVGVNTGGIPELINKEYVCKRKNYKQVANKILNLIQDKDKMQKEAKLNFEMAKNYIKEDLDKKRIEFINDTVIN